MRDSPVVSILRSVVPISPEHTVGRAAEALRASGLPALPVADLGRVVGIVTEAAVLSVLVKEDAASSDAGGARVESIISYRVACANQHMSVRQAAQVMSQYNLEVLPVVDEHGCCLGVVTRSDVASALSRSIRPPAVAGMATPLGVYLTTGHIRAGAGDLGLFLTGVALALMYFAATEIITGLAWLVERNTGFPMWTIVFSPPIHVPNWMDAIRTIMLGAAVPLFLLLLRVLPLSGYHAAEHQVVHAIERGEPLRPETVQALPRVHPRCGTNIVAAALVFLSLVRVLSNEAATIIVIFIMVFAWRMIGAYFQYYITTKPPSSKQLKSGIQAGASLLDKYRNNPACRVSGWRRIWNTGMPQVMLGAAATLGAEQVLRLLAQSLL